MTDPPVPTQPQDASQLEALRGPVPDEDRVRAEPAPGVFVYRLDRDDNIDAVARLGGLDADTRAALSNLEDGQFLRLRRPGRQIHVVHDAPYSSGGF